MVRRRTPLCGLSITLVETRHRDKLGDRPRRLTVNISAKPSADNRSTASICARPTTSINSSTAIFDGSMDSTGCRS